MQHKCLHDEGCFSLGNCLPNELEIPDPLSPFSPKADSFCIPPARRGQVGSYSSLSAQGLFLSPSLVILPISGLEVRFQRFNFQTKRGKIRASQSALLFYALVLVALSFLPRLGAMGKLYFRHGAVSSAKTLNLLAVSHNYKSQGKQVLLLKPAVSISAPALRQSL